MKCLCCMKESKKTYCTKCSKDFFDGRVVETLSFDKEGFISARVELKKTLSISGVQDKISLAFNDENQLLPVESNGRYILKPIPNSNFQNLKDIVANEHLSMQISAKIFKIETAQSALIKLQDGEMAYITKRFDYVAKDSTLKYDQEDFCSVLDRNSTIGGENYKYDSSYEEIAIAIDRYISASRIAQEDFLRRVILNFLLSNGDAHLKNFSLIRDKKEMKLSPSYDILNTKIHIDDAEMALDLLKDDEFTKDYDVLGYYSYADIKEFSLRQGIKEKRFTKILDEIVSYTPSVKEMIENSFLSNEMKEIYTKSYINNLEKKLMYKL